MAAATTPTVDPVVEDAAPTVEPVVRDTAQDVQLPPAHPYDSVISRMQSILREVEERINHGLTPDENIVFDAKREHLRIGIDLFTRAKTVPREQRQFGSPHAHNANLRLPPQIDEFANFPQLRFRQYRYITSEPVEIQFLRDMMATGQIAGLAEMEPGLVAAMPIYGNFIGFVDESTYTRLGEAGVLKTW